MSSLLMTTSLDGLTLISRGKVRDIYATSREDALLFIATDRISAFDVILNNGIPEKGKILTELSLFWFDFLKDVIPNHLITSDIDQMPDDVKQHGDVLKGRTMLVKKATVVPIEAIVRGYLTGSAWSEYKNSGTVHGITLPKGLLESQMLPHPTFTPSTKAEQGAHDENIHPDVAAALIEKLHGKEIAAAIARISVELYTRAAAYALSRGLILADTKFEFGVMSSGGSKELILIDEALTPDSSRYWPAEGYEPGKSQPSFDKQYLRDWMLGEGFVKGLEKGKDGNGWVIPSDIVEGTRKRYAEALETLTKK